MSWWTPVDLGEDAERTAQIGPLHLRIARRGALLRLAWRRDEGEGEAEATVSAQAPATPVEEGWTVQRVVAPTAAARVALRPVVADRPIVARPDVPFTVAPRGQISVFVNAPLWLAIETTERLIELPILPIKPTWFGTNREGTPCYAMRTHLRLDLDEVQARPHRAVAPIRIVNEGSDPLRIDRVRIPVPNLAIHAEGDRLWLPEIVLARESGQDDARLRRGASRSDAPITPAREPWIDNAVARAFNSIFR